MDNDVPNEDRLASLTHAYQQLQKSEAARVELISVIVHQLRSPLAAISLAHQTLQENETHNLTKQQLYILNNAEDRVRQIHQLTEKLLDLAASDMPAQSIHKGTYSVEKFLHCIIKRFLIPIEAKQITIDTNFANQTQAVKFDATLLADAINNLIDNAIQYTPEGGMIRISTSYTAHEVCITISDTGPGISEENLPNLFSKYTRFHDDQTVHPDGMGLGLYIAKQAVERHDGTIEYTMNKPQGSIFSVTLPLDA